MPPDLSKVPGLEQIFQPLNGDLLKVATAYIQIIRGVLVTGMVFTIIMSINSLRSMFACFHCLPCLAIPFKIISFWTHLLFGSICCILPFIVAVAIMDVLRLKTRHLPSWVQFEQGEVSSLCLGGLLCAGVVVVLSSIVTLVF